ncbi:helix-turn-helix domain-containing protein [Clostridium sp. C8-1-8]|uniref:GH39 family glycosyl hydrolase n=1 Tax=Clostridium sp. C8-1-8 TaxID=2698831 RepID=UPI00136AC4CC|nr:helix-turn-helix domain-containing protein [Clostridium sp. C8-1-8]
MRCYNEVINTIGEMPVRICIESIEELSYGCNPSITLIFVIKGEITLKKGDKLYTLKEEDIILINPNTMYSILGLNSNQVYILKLDNKYFDTYYNNFSNLIFELNSTEIKEQYVDAYDYIKNLMIKLLQISLNKKNGYLLIAKHLTIQIVIVLLNNFTVLNEVSCCSEKEYDERIDNIIKFVLEHYKEKISLEDIAKKFHLNKQYISRYFSRQMGITLNNFISKIRLEESINDLRNYDKKITYIALENGFPNLKSYFKAFKDAYNMTPSKYRSTYLKQADANIIDLKDLEANMKDMISAENLQLKLMNQEDGCYIIDCSVAEKSLNQKWRKLLAFGRAAEGMREELRNQLRLIQKEIPFQYVRFHGILSDEMMVYSEDWEGRIEYNFTYVDELIDFLLQIKLKPFLELGYMPEQLASEKKYIFAWRANISYPKSMKKWSELIESFVQHVIERYGVNEVKTWYFQICDQWEYFNENQLKYFDFFKETYNSVKKVEAGLLVGGTFDESLLEQFSILNEKYNIVLDFIAFRAYSIMPTGNLSGIENINRFSKKSDNKLILQDTIDYCTYTNENFISETIDDFLDRIGKYRLEVKEVFISEWNTTPSQKDLLHDTCFKAAFFAKNVIANYDKVHGMAYWSFSDIFEESKASNYSFHGGLGFITNNTIKKPVYHVYELMNRLEGNIVTKEEDYIVTKSENGKVQILAYNYCHFIEETKKCHSTDISIKERYQVFDERSKSISFIIRGLAGKAVERIYRINKKNGSAYDQWLTIGAPRYLSGDEINYIKGKSIFGYEMKEISIEGDFVINEIMEPHEVLLIEIIPK